MDSERPAVSPGDEPGDPRVDHAVSALAGLRAAPLDDHPAILEAVHDRLREILGELGEAADERDEPGTPPDAGDQRR
jgi:hypothetical protein